MGSSISTRCVSEHDNGTDGQEKAPAAFRRHGLVSALLESGLRPNDRGDVPGFRWRPDPQRPKAMNLDAVRRTAAAVADRVGQALADGESVLVLGGDCTVELGTVAGALRDQHSVGLIYIDLDVDLNAPETSDGAIGPESPICSTCRARRPS
jgi:arginase